MTTEERKKKLEELRKSKGVQSTGVQSTPTSSSSRAERLAQLRSQSTPTTTPVKQESGVLSALGKFGKGIYRDVASSVIAPARGALTGTSALLAGDTAGAQKEISGYYDPLLKEQISNPFAKRQGAGEFTANVVKGGANAFQFAPLGTGVKTGGALMSEIAGSGGINALKRLVGAGAKEGLAYAPSTALYSGASTALEGGNTKDVLKSTATGLALSPVLGATGSVLGGGLERATRGARAKLGSEVAQQTISNVAKTEAKDLNARAFDIRATKAQQKLEGKTGRTIEEIITDEQLPVGRKTEADGVVLDTKKAVPVVQQKLDALDKAMSSHLATQPQHQFDLKELGEQAIKNFAKKEKGSTEFKNGKQAIEEAINDFGNDTRYGQMTPSNSKIVTGEEMRAQKGSWGRAAWKQDNPQYQKALKTLYETANELIDTRYKDPTITDLNARMSELINTLSFLKTADNKVIRGGLLNQKIDQAANSLLGGLVGSTFEQVPVVGPVVGSLVGRGLTKIVGEWKRNPERLSNKAIDILRKAGVKSSTDELLERSAKVLNDLATKGKTKDTSVMNALKKAAQSSKKDTVIEGKIINTAGKNEEAFGALGGFETYKDEKGNTKVRYNPEKGAAGIALMAGITNPKVQSTIKNVSDDLIKEARKYKSAEEFVKAQGVQRIEEPNVKLSFDKPQGLYTSPANVVSPHQLGGEKTILGIKPSAKIITIEDSGKLNLNKRGVDQSAANLIWLRQELPDIANNIRGKSFDELKNIFSKEFPKTDWNRYNEIQDMIEGYAGLHARKNGVDVIKVVDKTNPEFSESVILNKDVVLTKSQLEQIWKEANKK